VTLKHKQPTVGNFKPKQPTVGNFLIVGALVTWAIYTQGQLLLWSSLIITGVVPGYRWPRWLRLQLSLEPGGVGGWIVHPIFLCTTMDCYWSLQNTQRVTANVTGIHDNEGSPLHILLLTPSVWVEYFLYMWPYLPWHNTTKPLTQERSYSAPGTERVFQSIYSHEHSDFKLIIHTSVCVNV